MGRRNLVAASTLQWEGSTMQVHRKQVAWRKPIISFLIAAFVLGAGWNNRARSETINIGWTGEYWSTLPFRVAADKGFFEREGLQARLITMRTALITPALIRAISIIQLRSLRSRALRSMDFRRRSLLSSVRGPAMPLFQSLTLKRFKA
jgi:hypothetical protein